MNLNRIEWSKAQDLLVQLVQILAPLAERERGTVSFLSGRFFVPPTENDNPLVFRYPVRVLKTTLHSAQEQVAEWIEQLPAAQEAETAALPSKRPLPSPSNRGGERLPNPPLSAQAKKLIDQVRDAIGSLCTSSNIVDPKAAPLREALLRIKPLIDEVIQAVSHEGMHSSDDEPSPKAPFHTFRARRQTPVAKHVPMPPHEPRPREETHLKRSVHVDQASNPAPRKEGEAEVRRGDRPALPGAPFVPETRTLMPARKKLKKKGARSSRDDDEKESEKSLF